MCLLNYHCTLHFTCSSYILLYSYFIFPNTVLHQNSSMQMTHTGLKAHVITNQNTKYNKINRAEAEPLQLYKSVLVIQVRVLMHPHIKYTYCRSGPSIHVALSSNDNHDNDSDHDNDNDDNNNNNNNKTFLLVNPVQPMIEPNACS